MSRNLLVALLIVAALAGCGPAAATTPSCAPLATATPVAAHAGAVQVTAAPGSAAPGQVIQIEVSVVGPASLVTDCTQPLDVAVTDTSGVSVDAGITIGTLPARCGPLTLGAGESLGYEATWLPDPTLPSGVYTVNVTVGDQPPLQLPVRIRTADGGCA